jgi:BT1 family
MTDFAGTVSIISFSHSIRPSHHPNHSYLSPSGFMSDVFPIYGMRRKPYLTIGALVYSSAFMLYALAAIDNVVRLGNIL